MKTIIFDMDGTLIDSSNPITETINIVRSRYNLSPLDKSEVVSAINCPLKKPSKYFYGTDEYLPEQKEIFVEHYEKSCTENIRLYDGIYELLLELDTKFHLAVATNADKRFAEMMLHALGIYQFFSEVIGACSVENAKPHPEMIEVILERLQTPKEHALLIGDSRYDELASQNASIEFLHVSWGFGGDIITKRSAKSAIELSWMIKEFDKKRG